MHCDGDIVLGVTLYSVRVFVLFFFIFKYLKIFFLVFSFRTVWLLRKCRESEKDIELMDSYSEFEVFDALQW